ncbi:MAG: M48 family metalloprotease [Candidatus Scalindua sp.]|nr:M48 family metalloprotease [Candidatus Scalindua sp.]
MRKLLVLLTLYSITLYGCAVNPVTGKRQLKIIPESQELRIGEQQYAPSRQMQGGDYEVDSSLTEYVNSVGQRLAAVSDRKLPYEFEVINNSIPNAWALPGGKIAVNRGILIELDNEAELAAVLGHEIVHAAARHGAQGIERGMLLQGAVAVTGVAAGGSNYANLAVRGAQMAAGLVNQKYGRDAERESDFYGMQYMSRAGYDPRAAITLQEVFVRLSEDRNQNTDWLSGLFSSHPPSQERVEANRETAKTLPATGELGVERYQNKIAHLKKTKKAYEAHDKGREALSKGKTEEALALANQANRIEPREGLFDALVGDAYLSQQQYQQALTNYDNAVKDNDKFFYFYVQRGLAKEKLGDQTGALKDLEKSTDLLPTATALNALGNLSLAQGNRQKAIRYFKEAVTSDSEPGRQASRSLVTLDLPVNPNSYLRTNIDLNQKRMVIVQISNPTPVSVRDVNVLIRYPDSQGRALQVVKELKGTIPPGKSALIETGIGPIQDPQFLRYLKFGVTNADVVK